MLSGFWNVVMVGPNPALSSIDRTSHGCLQRRYPIQKELIVSLKRTLPCLIDIPFGNSMEFLGVATYDSTPLHFTLLE
jgi:hypothetical protein